MRPWISPSASVHRRLGDRLGLHADQRGDQRQTVGDPVVDLVQQHFGAVPCFANLALGAIALALQPRGFDRLADRAAQQLEEFIADGLCDIVGGARLERRDRDRGFAGRR